ncbi:hypothetical protein I3843_04G155200 [Carya illinoinensis]|uniref:Myb/SANT-like DNA-binding domain-containing protein n=1 Tax=Carya illinoinensis TaxID=32201 RepID=A0A8T1QX19_CARIL|nr:trihelix transcription factor ASIL2-like isoform X1 [Carya illinoinensis]KAG2713181.1 hypothetical protein I3760_04G164100 [Carya illinoinensis]KAG6658502.1 hypothetical protein CIPAW_04G166100 [Carya illinoinensis]KAG6718694.1 hypothetical protein I3842_04G165200 [Carya illinoinensis]KAG7984334.1 hypothetical protein I3843_04G155200 [Carya illinoinensis]
MGDMEDDARYSGKSYALNPYNTSHRPRNLIPSSNYTHPIRNNYEVEDDDEFDVENDRQEDEEEEEDENPNGYYRNLEADGNFNRHPKKRKLRNSISGYESMARSAKDSYSAWIPEAEWTEHAVFVLLEVWGDRFLQLGRKSLRSEDWNDVAEKVSEASKTERTEVQCRAMMDKLKRKYKKEKAKVDEMGSNSSKWVYFKKMDMLMASSPRQDFGLACGVDSGEYVFMNTWVYLDRSNGFDEMRDSPGESENDEEDGIESDEPPRRTRARGRGEGSLSYRVVADSIQKFGDIYEKIESGKRQHMMELEKMRLEFQRELELQKKQILERAQTEIAKMQEEDDDEDSDSSEENLTVEISELDGI